MSSLVEERLDASASPPGRNALAVLRGLRDGGSIRARAPLATGFRPLDDVLDGGVRAGELLVLGGKPGIGKTVLAVQWARSIAMAGDVAVLACYEHDETTLLARLLACELGDVIAGSGAVDAAEVELARGWVRNLSIGGTWEGSAAPHPLVSEAEHRLASYADRLVLVAASGTGTDLVELRRTVQRHRVDAAALVVDYVQKIPTASGHGAVRLTEVVEGLKELALADDVAVIGVAGAGAEGLAAKRLRIRHLRGAESLAYEADTVLLLNEKVDVVSKVHLAYDTTRLDDFARRVVCSVEKNRRGVAGVDLEFTKDLASYRFDPAGRWVAERLWDEGTVES